MKLPTRRIFFRNTRLIISSATITGVSRLPASLVAVGHLVRSDQRCTPVDLTPSQIP